MTVKENSCWYCASFYQCSACFADSGHCKNPNSPSDPYGARDEKGKDKFVGIDDTCEHFRDAWEVEEDE